MIFEKVEKCSPPIYPPIPMHTRGFRTKILTGLCSEHLFTLFVYKKSEKQLWTGNCSLAIASFLIRFWGILFKKMEIKALNLSLTRWYLRIKVVFEEYFLICKLTDPRPPPFQLGHCCADRSRSPIHHPLSSHDYTFSWNISTHQSQQFRLFRRAARSFPYTRRKQPI